MTPQMALHHRILVVDDHSSFRHMLRDFLESNPNWEVCGEAADGCEAVEKSAELNPDIVIMDLDMPRLNGFEATRRIHEALPETRVLILTLHEFPALPQIAHDSGAQGVISKSQSFQVLSEAIQTLDRTDAFFSAPQYD